MCMGGFPKGHGIRVSFSVKVPGLAADFSITIDEKSTPEEIRKQIEEQGIRVPEKSKRVL